MDTKPSDWVYACERGHPKGRIRPQPYLLHKPCNGRMYPNWFYWSHVDCALCSAYIPSEVRKRFVAYANIVGF